MDFDLLKEIGLSNGEIKVYKALLQLGISPLKNIQSKTGIDRRNIYDILSKLIEKSLVSQTIEKGIQTYQCTNPRFLKESVQTKKNKLEKIEKGFEEIENLFNISIPDVRAEILRGNEGVKTLFDDILTQKESCWLGGNSFENYTAIPKGLEYWFNQWMKRRIEKKHQMYDLVDYGTYLKGYKPENINKLKENYYQYCQLPKDLKSPMVIAIYGNKVAQILWSDKAFIVILESEKIKESFMKYFNYFWQKRK